MAILDETRFGLPNRENYGFAEMDAMRRIKPLQGRARYRLRDNFNSLAMDVTFTWDDDQFRQFKQFWSDEIRHGADWFTATLMLGDYRADAPIKQYQVHATDQFRAQHNNFGYWHVTIPLEVAWGKVSVGCDFIYGGPLTNPAQVIVYGGPISNFGTDVIAPCPIFGV